MDKALGSLVIELGASTASLKSDFDAARTATDKVVGDINLKINSIGAGANFSGVSSQVRGLIGDFTTLKNVIGAGIGIDIGLSGLKDVANLADEYQTVSNRIRSTVADSQQLAQVQQEIFRAAQQTGTAIDDTAKTYQRLEQVIEGTGASQVQAQQQAVALTKELNEEIAVSGVSSAEASRAIMDLVHGLAGGELQARQFNQIMRQFPDLAKQIADGLGVSSQQLEKMVHAGLPAAEVLRALSAQSEVINQRFSALPQTFARAWTQLDNAVEKYVGEAAQASAVSDLVKSAIVGVANNIGAVATGAEAVGLTLAAWGTGKTLQGIGSLTSSLKDAVTAQGAYKTAAIASAEADIANAEAVLRSTAATIAKADARNDLRAAELAELQATQASLLAEQAMNEQLIASTKVYDDQAIAVQRNVAIRAELGTTTARLAALEDAMASSQARATLAEQTEAAATAELTVAKQGLAAATVEATSATGLFSRAGSGLLAAVGGLSTILVAAGAGVLYLASRESDLAKEADALRKITDELTRSHGDLSPALAKTAEAAYEEKEAHLQAAQAALAQMEATTKLSVETKGLANFNANNSAYAKARADVEGLTAEINNMTAAYLKAKFAAAAKSLTDALFPDLRGALSQIDALTEGIDKQTAKFQEQAATYGKGHAALVQYEKDQELAKLSIGQSTEAIVQIKAAMDQKYAADLKAAAGLDAITAASKSNKKELTEQQQATQRAIADNSKLGDMLAELSEKYKPISDAQKQYDEGLKALVQIESDYADAGLETEDVLTKLGQAWTLLEQRRDHQIAKAQATLALQQQEGTAVDQLVRKYQEEDNALGMSDDAREKLQAELSAERAMREAIQNTIQSGHPVSAQEIADLVATAKAHADLSIDMKASRQVMAEWTNIVKQAGDTVADDFAKALVEGESLMKGLQDVAKQTVEAIISYFVKLAIINPILNSIFGTSVGGGSLLPTLANSAFGSVLSGGAGGAGGAAGGSSGLGMLSMAGIGSGLSTLWGGTATGGSSILGSGIGQNFMGPLAEGQSYGYTPSTFGNVLGIAGGVYAGYNEFQNAGGGLNGVAGGAAYGLGTLTAAGAIGGIASGAGAAAGAAGSLGAVGLGAIPVVGWIALGLMLLDKFTGGNVFGTSYKPTGVTGTSVDIGDSGVTVGDWYQEHKHGALFSGGKYKNVDVDATQDQIDAFNQAYKSEQDSITASAKALGVTAGDAITGAWQTTVDKTGKVIDQSSTVLGQKYSEDAQHFFERVTADSVEALLPASQELTDFFNQFQSNADNLADAANMLVSAQVDINKGMGLLGDADTSLADIGTLVQSLQMSGESLAAAYVRVQTEQLDLQAGLDELGLSTGKTGEDFVKFADDAAQAAGGIDNLNSELATLYAAYIPVGQQVAHSREAMQKATDEALSAVGESTTESMAQFWADFQTAMPNLTPDELQQWIAAGVALANYTNAVTDSAQKYAEFQISNYGDSFIASMAGIVEAEKQQIDTANQLAQAAGLAGASQKDIADIMKSGSAQMGKAIADLTNGITQDISALNTLTSTGDKQLDLNNALSFGTFSTGNVSQQQQHAQQMSTAYDLIEKLGDFSFGTGETIDQVLKDFGLSPGAIGKILGENADQVRDQIQAAADTASSMTDLVAIGQEQTDILQDLLDVAQGKAPTIDLTKYTTPTTTDGDDSSTKPGAGTGKLPPGSQPMQTRSPDVVSAIREHTAVSRATLATMTNAGRYVPTPRNTRGSLPA